MRNIRSPIDGIVSPLRGFRTGSGVLWFGFNTPLLWVIEQGTLWFGTNTLLLWGAGVSLRWGSDDYSIRWGS